jgi:hypothetical protein
VPTAAFPGQRAAFIRQKDRAILRAGDQALARQTVERLAHSRHLHAKARGDLHRARFAMIVDQFCDQFDIVLGQFAPRFADALKRLGAQVCRAVIGRGRCRVAGSRSVIDLVSHMED